MVLCALIPGICSYGQMTGERSAATILSRFLHPSGNYVLIAAHRGDWRNAPENSMHALERCLKMGVDIMETDVRKTRDGVLVLMHDVTINRTTTGKGNVGELSYDSLNKVWLRQGHGGVVRERIPTLEEAMLYVKGKPILINLDKAWDIIPEAYAILRKTGTVDQAIFKGNETLEAMRLKYGAILDSIHYMPMVWPMDYNIYGETAAEPELYVAGFYKDFSPAGFEVIFDRTDAAVFTKALPAIRKYNTTIWINTLWDELCAGHTDEAALGDADANWGWIIQQGATVIQTDRPRELLDYLRKKGLHD